MFRLAALLALAALSLNAVAGDADGCKDHPLFNRLPGYELTDCQGSDFDGFDMPASVNEDTTFKTETVEGQRSSLTYNPAEGVAAASSLKVIRNFQNAIRSAGGTVVGEWAHGDFDLSPFGGGNRMTTLKLVKNGQEVWVLVQAWDDAYYTLTILQKQAMEQAIVANELLDALNRDGFITLQVNFDTGKATIKPDSAKTLDDAAAVLKAAPTVNIEVGGHTDDVGGADANLKLSDERAKSVVAALVARGVPASRLTAKGYGQTKPVADNRTEAGRAQNRRVELVKR